MIDGGGNISNCIEGSKPSSYDLPGRAKRIKIGEVLTVTRLNDETIMLAKVDTQIASNSKLQWSEGGGAISDLIQIGAIARIIF
jgi:hypothetical protein